MPSLATAPAQFQFTGGNSPIEPVLLASGPAVFAFAGGSAGFGPASNLAAGTETPELDRLTRFERLQTGEEIDKRFQQLWQQTMEAIEQAFAAVSDRVTDLSTIVARLEASERLAQAAQATANDTSKRESLVNSYTDPVSPLTANADGSIDIEAHTRIYGDGAQASLSAGSVAGFAGGDYVSVYYMDAARSGSGVQYKGTTSPIAQQGDTHVIGQVTIPQAGQPPATGGGSGAPGYTPPPGGGGTGSYD